MRIIQVIVAHVHTLHLETFYHRPIRNWCEYISVTSIDTGEASAKCAMCGKKTAISDKHARKGEKDQQEPDTSNMIVEQIDGTCYTFDTADCALMFKKFSGVYGSSFADE